MVMFFLSFVKGPNPRRRVKILQRIWTPGVQIRQRIWTGGPILGVQIRQDTGSLNGGQISKKVPLKINRCLLKSELKTCVSQCLVNAVVLKSKEKNNIFFARCIFFLSPEDGSWSPEETGRCHSTALLVTVIRLFHTGNSPSTCFPTLTSISNRL